MKTGYAIPHIRLLPFIERYWFVDGTQEGGERHHIAPGVGLDLFFHSGKPFLMESGSYLPDSHLIFSGKRATRLYSSRNTIFIAARFRAGMFKNFCSQDFQELRDTFAGAGEIWGMSGRDINDQLAICRDMPAKIHLLDRFFLGLLEKYRRDTPAWNCVVQKLFYDFDSIRSSEISGQIRMSRRHFERRIRAETGFSPKHFLRLARFHSAMKSLLVKKKKDYLEEALSRGFFDQSHFIKEFKSFMGVTPSVFLTDENFMSHFYYPALRKNRSF